LNAATQAAEVAEAALTAAQVAEATYKEASGEDPDEKSTEIVNSVSAAELEKVAEEKETIAKTTKDASK